uniref:Aminopeptidase n=1 Tax=Glossina brevipalpis TaxID=37001 RepID=A0A1A9WGS8_9MUSC
MFFCGLRFIALQMLVYAVAIAASKTINKRSVDLSATRALISDVRLPTEVVPTGYDIHLYPIIEKDSFTGTVHINISWSQPIKKISLHAHYDLNLNERTLNLLKINKDSITESIPILRGDRMIRKTIYVIYLKNTVQECSQCVLKIDFEGNIWKSAEGLFKGSYVTGINNEEKHYLATSMRPNNARRLFPCFDEPGFKVPFTVSIARPKSYVILFNTPLTRTEIMNSSSELDYVIDYFEPTPPMSTFTFGFVISQLNKLKREGTLFMQTQTGLEEQMEINLWARQEALADIKDVYEKLYTIYDRLIDYFNVSLPLKKIDVIAIPELDFLHPADCWGLLMFKERDLFKPRYYILTYELIYQWLGSWITPNWWDVSHINKALVGFLTTAVIQKIDDNRKYDLKYPLSGLYSLYYEFSKRYPHSKITGIKQEMKSYKTEMILRMLNYSLSESTFQAGIRNFVADYQYKAYFSNNLWDALTKQAITDGMLDSEYSIGEIATSWITKDRLPMITVDTDFNKNNDLKISQKLYLRERPHDVPEQHLMLWWIPIVIISQNNLNFNLTKPTIWMKEEREIILSNISSMTENSFVIINPEEIGPFPVNYDSKNWNLLLSFLLKEDGRSRIPAYTRAKLIHDAWNLAYAGELSFVTVFNMTLFMKYERTLIVWTPVLTFIDHIGRHIDMSKVHKKFEMYVQTLLTPLYEELHNPEQNSWQNELKTSTERFLCHAGYKPCIEKAHKNFQLWMESANPDLDNVLPNNYICPVFKWGTIDEWEFGLERVITFPKNRTQSERTYLLKTLAGCPQESNKIIRLLNITILEENGNFSANDALLIFSMLTGGSPGYITLYNFLSENWSEIKRKFESKTNLWDNLISAATGQFKTSEGYEMVKTLYNQHKEEFGSATHIIESSLKNIKEEAKWSDENLPVIEEWLDNFLSNNNRPEEKFVSS